MNLRSLIGRCLNRLGLIRPPHRCYPKWIRQRLKARRFEYPAKVEPGLFSILTPVCDPPPHCLRELAQSVLNQDYPAFEWIIVDNGSVQPAVRRLLDGLRRDQRVRLVRLPRNKGIVAGTRAALEHASNRYVLPVDHDDRLYPDALRVVAAFLQAHGDLPILYSDEDKLAHGRPAHPLFKPDWDPALFLNCCYVTHLSVIDRRLALDLGAYTNPDAEGCPDWDLYCRFIRAGHVPEHIAEILYSWRMHARSTASPNSHAKPYALDCQRRLLEQHLRQSGLARRFEVRPNPLYGEAGVWHPVRKPIDPPPLHVLVLKSQAPQANADRVLAGLAETGYPALTVKASTCLAEVRSFCAALPPESLVAVLDGELLAANLDWPWEAAGLFELHSDAAVVGGRITDRDGTVLSAGEVFGFQGLLGSPDAGRHETERGMPFLCQHTADAVSPRFFITRAGFLVESLPDRPRPVTHSMLHAWVGAAARRRGLRVIYSPYIVARQLTLPTPETFSEQDQLDFVHENADLLGDVRNYSRFLSLRPNRGYRLAAGGERDAVLRKSRSLAQAMRRSCV